MPVASQIPNLISVARLLLVPWFALLLLAQEFDWALALFALMGVLDLLDGYLARKLNATSALGALLDPLADKAMLMTSFAILGYVGLLPLWLVVLAVSRDVMCVGGVLLQHLFYGSRRLKILAIGKFNIFLQVVLVLAVLGQPRLELPMAFQIGLLWIVTATTVVSGLWYAVDWLRALEHSEDEAL